MLRVYTTLKDCYLIKQSRFDDNRGSFYISYNDEEFDNFKMDHNWLQENYSINNNNVLRGLHIQPNYPQAKLVSCQEGKIIDAVIDLRKDSPTYLKHECFSLKPSNSTSLYVPAGFAHGFIALEHGTIVSYKIATNGYHPEDEVSIFPFDDEIGINWGIDKRNIEMSDKDYHGISLQNYIQKHIN